MISQDNYDAIVASLYDAPGDPDRWSTALARLCDAFGAAASVIEHYDFAARSRFDGLVSRGYAPEYIASYRAYYHYLNPWLRHEAPYRRPGQVWRSEDLVPFDEVTRTEFFYDWMRPQGLAHNLRAVVSRDGPRLQYALLVRRLGDEPFDDAQVAAFERIMPHLQRAVGLTRLLDQSRLAASLSLSALDRLPTGVILIDAGGQARAANAAAERILAQDDGLGIERDGLCAATADDTAALRRSIAAAARTDRPVGGALQLRRRSDRRPLNVFVTPAGGERPLFGDSEPRVAVFVSDPDRPHDPDPALLTELHGLTRQEARLAVLLAQGCTLAAAADGMGVGLATVRTHLKHLFTKTGTQRQAELVQYLLRCPCAPATPGVDPGAAPGTQALSPAQPAARPRPDTPDNKSDI